MFLGIEPFYCIIYRLTTMYNNDFSASNEGEVDENWGVVSFGTPCRYDLGPTAYRRRSDGMVHVGTRNFYVEGDVDIDDGDRIAVNGTFYQVRDVENVYDMFNAIHHKQATIDIIDWNTPDILTQWVDEANPTTNEIVEVAIDYTSTSPKYMATVNDGDIVGKVGLLVEQLFDDGTTISVGDSSDNEILMATTDNIPTIVQYYEVMSNYEVTATEDINLYFSIPEGSSNGIAHAFIEIVRAY